jgi:hypothetical protein
MNEITKISLFNGKKIRKTLHNNEWWFSVYDVVGVLTNSKDPREYFNKVLQRDEVLNSTYGQFVHKLPLMAEDGKMRDQVCAKQKAFSALSSQSHHQRRNHLNSGSQRSDMNGFRKLKIRSLQPGAPVHFIRPRAIRMHGLRNVYAVLRFAKN